MSDGCEIADRSRDEAVPASIAIGGVSLLLAVFAFRYAPHRVTGQEQACTQQAHFRYQADAPHSLSDARTMALVPKQRFAGSRSRSTARSTSAHADAWSRMPRRPRRSADYRHDGIDCIVGGGNNVCIGSATSAFVGREVALTW